MIQRSDTEITLYVRKQKKISYLFQRVRLPIHESRRESDIRSCTNFFLSPCRIFSIPRRFLRTEPRSTTICVRSHRTNHYNHTLQNSTRSFVTTFCLSRPPKRSPTDSKYQWTPSAKAEPVGCEKHVNTKEIGSVEFERAVTETLTDI